MAHRFRALRDGVRRNRESGDRGPPEAGLFGGRSLDLHYDGIDLLVPGPELQSRQRPIRPRRSGRGSRDWPRRHPAREHVGAHGPSPHARDGISQRDIPDARLRVRRRHRDLHDRRDRVLGKSIVPLDRLDRDDVIRCPCDVHRSPDGPPRRFPRERDDVDLTDSDLRPRGGTAGHRESGHPRQPELDLHLLRPDVEPEQRDLRVVDVAARRALADNRHRRLPRAMLRRPVEGTIVLVETKNLTKVFGEVRAVDDLSVAIPEGAIGLVGPNGAGKTTFLRLLLSLLQPTAGTAKVLGRNILDGVPLRERIGYMPEHDCLIPDMTGVGLVAFMGRVSGLDADSAIGRAHDVLQFVGVEEERYRKVAEYSTGMKQKVKLAQSMVHDPQLYIFDEPTTGLDPRGRTEM